MTQAERNVIEAVRAYRELHLQHGPWSDDTITALNDMFVAFTRLETERATGYWREVGA